MIDTSFLLCPEPEKPGEKWNGQGWGFLDPANVSVSVCWEDIANIISPDNILEIGFFAGHSSTTMLNIWPKSNVISFDPGSFARRAHKNVKDKFPDRFKFYPVGINKHHGDLPNIDLMFIDGSHAKRDVEIDIAHINILKPKYVLFDNVELGEVRTAIKAAGLMDSSKNPLYFFYTCNHKGKTCPGIMMLLIL